MENLTAALLIASGLALAAAFTRYDAHESLAPAQSFLATTLLVIGISWIVRGAGRPFHGPTLAQIAAIGASYGAVAAALTLALPTKVPKILHGLVGALCVAAGVLLLLFQLRVIQPQ